MEFFHFPIRSLAQCERKYAHQQTGAGQTPSPYYDRVRRLREEGRLDEYYNALVVDDDALERGLRDGSLVIDARLRDAVHALRRADGRGEFALPVAGESRLTFSRPTVVDDAAYAVDVAALGEADVIRLQRRLDTLEQRLTSLERRPAMRAYRKVRQAAKNLLRRRQA